MWKKLQPHRHNLQTNGSKQNIIFYPISDAFIDRNPMAIVFVYHSNVGEK